MMAESRKSHEGSGVLVRDVWKAGRSERVGLRGGFPGWIEKPGAGGDQAVSMPCVRMPVGEAGA